MIITSVNISTDKGVVKTPVGFIEADEYGIKNDAHSGDWHRQVSLLSTESIREFEKITKCKYKPGDFAENITLSGMRLNECRPGDILRSDTVTMMVTQIGKKCHGTGCSIFSQTGSCIMPNEGIFAKVLNGGTLKAGDIIVHEPKIWDIAVITLSNRAYKGEYDDRSGPAVISAVEKFTASINRKANISYFLLPDDKQLADSALREEIANRRHFIFTTGGTGIGPQDITPSVVNFLLDYEIPGIMEHIRTKYGSLKPNALLSRSVAGVAGESIIFTLPGGLKAVDEYLSEILPLMEHMFYMKMGFDTH